AQVLRLDTHESFQSPEAWEVYDAADTSGLDTRGYSGATFDGRHVYFVPFSHDEAHGNVLRLDTRAEFTSQGAWTAYDANGTSGLLTKGYQGATFDGRYVYFSPTNNGTYHGHVLRLDTHIDFHHTGAWDAFGTGTTEDVVTKGYVGAIYDGRHVYFVPDYATEAGGSHGRVLRLDTLGGDTGSGDGSWGLLAGRAGQVGYASGPSGPAAVLETSDGHFQAGVSQPLSPGWHHMAMVWEDDVLTLWLDGLQAASTDAPGDVPDTQIPLMLGGAAPGGAIDEVALWSPAPTADTLAWRPTPYPTEPQSVTTNVEATSPGTLVGFSGFAATVDEPPNTTVTFQLSVDDGASWLYWSETAWVSAESLAESTSAAEVHLHIGALTPQEDGLLVRTVLHTEDETTTPRVESMAVNLLWVAP
ncbi:MAG: hypothetical protein QF464_04965, partial [Myxococcota bacterium]|nr:hypothetical protein [Myxococcota bacterium]